MKSDLYFSHAALRVNEVIDKNCLPREGRIQMKIQINKVKEFFNLNETQILYDFLKSTNCPPFWQTTHSSFLLAYDDLRRTVD